MSSPQGLIDFPGVVQPLSGHFTLSHGISPSVATLVAAPQAHPVAEGGTLRLTFGGVRLAFPGCRVHAVSMNRSSGTTLTLQILDRRWKWRFGEISGHYNLRQADGDIDPATRKTPQQLAALLLETMGEAGFSVAELPNHPFPEVKWSAANPAQELASLCDALGCRIVLQIDNRVVIRRIGSGRLLPTGPQQMTAGLGIDPPERPDSIKVVGGPTRFQSKFELQAVGLDRDDSIRPIDRLSYRPAEGWEHTDPSDFLNVADPHDRALALQSVFRWYRLLQQADGGTQVPGYPSRVSYLWQVLPINDVLLETYTDREGTERPRPAVVEGVYWPRGLDLLNTESGTMFDGSFRIHKDEGIVEFPEPVVKLGHDHTTQPADLFLTCTYSVRELETRSPVRYALERQLPGRRYGTGAQIVRRSDLVRTVRAVYDARNRLVDRIENRAPIEREARHQLDAAQIEHQLQASSEIEYAGLVPINPDGAIQQVSWSIGPGGTRTRAGRNIEFAANIPSYRQRRRRERIDRLVEG